MNLILLTADVMRVPEIRPHALPIDFSGTPAAIETNLKTRREARRLLQDGVTIVDTLGAVSVVGAGINATFDTVRRGSAALAARGVAAPSVTTSSFRVTWLVPRRITRASSPSGGSRPA